MKAVRETATRRFMEWYDPEANSRKDRNKKVTRAVFSYFTESGVEYRRAAEEAPENTPESDMWDLAPRTITVPIERPIR